MQDAATRDEPIAPSMSSAPPALSVGHVSHAFGDTKALEDVSLAVPR